MLAQPTFSPKIPKTCWHFLPDWECWLCKKLVVPPPRLGSLWKLINWTFPKLKISQIPPWHLMALGQSEPVWEKINSQTLKIFKFGPLNVSELIVVKIWMDVCYFRSKTHFFTILNPKKSKIFLNFSKIVQYSRIKSPALRQSKVEFSKSESKAKLGFQPAMTTPQYLVRNPPDARRSAWKILKSIYSKVVEELPVRSNKLVTVTLAPGCNPCK